MAVETGQAIRAAIYSRVTADTTLKSLFGQSGAIYMYRVQAPKDPAFPYIVDRLSAPGWPEVRAIYWLDLWYYGDSPATVDSAVERIRTLLENWRIVTGDSEIGAGRMIFNPHGSGYVPTDNEYVWHYSTMWSILAIADRLTGLVG